MDCSNLAIALVDEVHGHENTVHAESQVFELDDTGLNAVMKGHMKWAEACHNCVTFLTDKDMNKVNSK